MKKYLVLFLKLSLLWLLFFNFQRLLFIVHFFKDIPENSFWELAQIPYHSFRLDLSSYAYLNTIPLLFLFFSCLLNKGGAKNFFIRLSLVLIFVLMVFTAVIFAGELVSYIEWRTKLSSKIYVHLKTPGEVFRTSGWVYSLWFLFYLILQILFFFYGYKIFLKKTIKEIKEHNFSLKTKLFSFSGFFIFGNILLVLAMRGGLQQIPISATTAYFSNHQIINDISVNSFWNFLNMTSLHLKSDLESFYNTLSEEEAKTIKDEMYAYIPSDSIPEILNKKTPNIILVTMESWSAQMLAPLGGEQGITPYFNKLCEEGILFTQAYATSATSETGHTSIISGYPSIPGYSISSESAKCRKLPSISQSIKPLGYYSSYYFGGDLTYGNIGGYLKEMGFDKLTDEKDLDLHPKGKLGYHDEAMFPYFYKEIEKAKRPYFYGLFTQSTHAPYDMPFETVEGYPKESEGYITSLRYADLQIERFVKKLEQLPDFENTLVIFVSDHSRTHYKNYDVYAQDFYHIPILFWGGAIKNEFKGMRIDKICSQMDISKTLLNQMNLNTKDFKWSKDILDENSPEFAICSHTYTYSIKLKEGFVSYHVIDKKIVFSNFENKEEEEKALKICTGIVESIYHEYWNM